MTKKVLIVLFIICVLILVVTGYYVENLIYGDKDLIGSYECDSWNGGSEYIIIQDNFTIIFMGEEKTYKKNGDKIKIEGVSQELRIVQNGLLYGDYMFKKNNNKNNGNDGVGY